MKTISRNEKIIKIQIWDTAGMEKYQSITKSYYRGAQACLIVFDITNRESFDSIGNWIENFNNFSNPNIEKIIILIGNKCDLGIDRKINFEEAENFSRVNNLFYYETSAKEDINAQKVFINAAKELYLTHLQYKDRASRFGSLEPTTYQPNANINNNLILEDDDEKPRKKRTCC